MSTNPPADPANDAYVATLNVTRDAIFLIDDELPLIINQSSYDDLEAELLALERERNALKDRFRAYKANPAGINPPDAATIAKIADLSDQVDGMVADQAKAQAIVNLVSDVTATAETLFTA